MHNRDFSWNMINKKWFLYYIFELSVHVLALFQVEALHESKKLNEALQSEIVKLDSEYRVEKESEQRQNYKLKELVEDLQRDKKIAERSCEALNSEVTVSPIQYPF